MTDNLRDHTAERQLLAIALHGHTGPVVALPADAWDHWHHQHVARAIRTLAARGLPTDPEIVMREVLNNAGGDSTAQRLGGIVAELALHPVPADSAGYYADRLAALHSARHLNRAIEDFRGKVTYAAENDDDQVFATSANEMREALIAAETAFRPAPVEPPMSLGALLDAPDEPYDWLVPDLLERTDRLIVTGFEGTGKSYYLAQMALCVAAGIHPFTTDPLPEQDYRTLVFDCENSKRQMRRRYRRIANQVDRLRSKNDMPPVDWHEAVRIVSRPEGVALTEPREMARIEQNIALTAPDLVVAGPLYKLSIKLNIQEEQAAQELVGALDALRVRHGFTLICEAHAGHSNDGGGQRRVRPIGSSLFLRWPEFGYGLSPHADHANEEHPSVVEVKHWRGSREERAWPRLLQHGDFLPWEPTTEYFNTLRERRTA